MKESEKNVYPLKIRGTCKMFMITKLTIFMVLILCLESFASVNSKATKLSLKDASVSLVPAEQPQKKEIKGKVIERDNMPMAGVSVVVKGTTAGIATDKDGNFTLSVPADAKTLMFSFIGYDTQEISIGSKSFINIEMNPKQSLMDEIAVVGYGTAKRKDVVGSVTRVGAVELDNSPMGSTVQSLLQGRAAGVNVSIQSASPTSPISVIIRGASSLTGNNQPLWVIDGVPEYSAGTSGNITNTLYNLNLNDVESIDILKDASATAIYGSRAANGVVIVQTKRGKEGMKPTIEVSHRSGLQVQDFNGYEYFDAPTYINFADKAAREEAFGRGVFDYFTRLYLDEQAFMNLNATEFTRNSFKILPGAYYEGNTNWLKEMTQNPWTHQQDLSLRGGTQNIAYYVSFNHNKMGGIVKTGNSELFGGRLNIEAKIRKELKFGVDLSGSSRNTNDKDYMLDVLKKVRPDIPPYNPDGSLFTRDAYTENPYTTLKNTLSGFGKTFSGTGFLELSVFNGFMFKTAFTINYVDSESLTYKRRGSTFNYDGSRSWGDTKANTTVWENTATYAKTFGKHDILALAGYSMEKYSSLNHGMNASNFPDDDVLNDFSSAATKGNLVENYTANALISQFARATYKYNNRYIFSGTIRQDGSSRFGPEKRWGTFPSGGIAWLITEEGFMKGDFLKKYITYLKLRASHGLSGSQNLGNYNWRTGIGSARYNENPAIIPSTIGNTELQWEQTLMTDIGLDYGLWEERIRGSLGVYQKLTDHLIYSQPLPPSSAFASISANVASMKNQGIEFDIRVDVIKKNDLTFTIDFNAAKNTTWIKKINGITKQLNFSYMMPNEGDKTSEWFGWQTANRLFVTQEEVIAMQTQTTTGAKQVYRNSLESVGDLIFIDQNMDGKIDISDKVKLGSAEPKMFGGFGATVLYKGLMVNSTFTYAYGHKRFWQMPFNDVGYVGNYNHSNLVAGQSAILLNPYEATMPRATQYGDGGNGSQFSDFFLYDASYIRLNALNVSYRLPVKLLKDMIIQGVDLTFQATNLITITKYPGFDPQGNWSSTAVGTGMGVDASTYPSAKVFNFGIKVTLK